MNFIFLLITLLLSSQAFATPSFIPEQPYPTTNNLVKGAQLCATAKETLAYLNKGAAYDPLVIHEGKIFKLPLERVKATLVFICQNQNKLQDPEFIKKHFEFIRWYPDIEQTKAIRANKPLLLNIPKDKILMTKYYVHKARALTKAHEAYHFALYGLPRDEENLTLEQANAKPTLTRFQYGKQAILNGALTNKKVPALAYLTREDLEAALMQGTLVADFGNARRQFKIFNVHRCNNIAYDKTKPPYQQERYWYFKPVNGIKGYGKDAEHKITVNPEVTFAADLEQFGLGKLLMIQYAGQDGTMSTRMGIMADTGGAFLHNQYQVDFLTGSYAGQDAFVKASRHLPDYVAAYFMVLKK